MESLWPLFPFCSCDPHQDDPQDDVLSLRGGGGGSVSQDVPAMRTITLDAVRTIEDGRKVQRCDDAPTPRFFGEGLWTKIPWPTLAYSVRGLWQGSNTTDG